MTCFFGNDWINGTTGDGDKYPELIYETTSEACDLTLDPFIAFLGSFPWIFGVTAKIRYLNLRIAIVREISQDFEGQIIIGDEGSKKVKVFGLHWGFSLLKTRKQRRFLLFGITSIQNTSRTPISYDLRGGRAKAMEFILSLLLASAIVFDHASVSILRFFRPRLLW